MKKEEIYRLIEYNGVYDDKIKKNLKKLLKKYHPDHRGDNKVIKVLFEVKKELESGNTSYKANDNVAKKTYDNNLECVVELKKLYKEKDIIDDKLHVLYQELSSSFKEYSNCYREYCRLQNEYCNNMDKLKQKKNIVKTEWFVYLILFLVIVFLSSKYSIYYLMLVFSLVILFLGINYWWQKKIETDTSDYSSKQNIYDKKIKNIRLSIDKNSDAINELKREVQKISDNIRYYDNLLNKKDGS